MYCSLLFGSPEVRIAIVPWNPSLSPSGSQPQQLEGVIPLDRRVDVQRNFNTGRDASFDITLEKPETPAGIPIPNGTYKVLLRVLRLAGDPHKEEDWESWLSPLFGVYPLPDAF